MIGKLLVILLFAKLSGANPIISPLTTLVRVPEQDSAIIQSERVGGNFAYSTVEGHAYAALNPIIENIQTPIGVNYKAHPIIAPVPLPVYNIS